MGTLLKITKLPLLNSIVIKQSGGHLFISAPNSFLIDKNGFLEMVSAFVKVGFIDKDDLLKIIGRSVNEN